MNLKKIIVIGLTAFFVIFFSIGSGIFINNYAFAQKATSLGDSSNIVHNFRLSDFEFKDRSIESDIRSLMNKINRDGVDLNSTSVFVLRGDGSFEFGCTCPDPDPITGCDLNDFIPCVQGVCQYEACS